MSIRTLAQPMSRSLAQAGKKSVPATFRAFSTSQAVRAETPPEDDPKKGGKTFWSALLYGSAAAKSEGLTAPKSAAAAQAHSKLIGRGKYVHEVVTHHIHPAAREAYLAAADKYYRALLARAPEFGGIKVTGAWEVVVGSVGEFVHIFEYEGYKGFDEAQARFRGDEEMASLQAALLPHLQSRQHQLVSEFSFWPSSPPRDSGFKDGGVFEMRTYRLHPGKLLEWENAWRRGLEARRRFVSPVGAFFSQVGQLHEVHHIWQYPDMETRKATREQAWSVGTWSDTVQETVKLTRDMKTSILKPLAWSPLR
ncbi:uncharacterized protein MKK02DRAFT_41916 [Dioszegia hungarica]|uniref:NIPSNAP domain-containing protein n=1 Tax=Dioszegia hungarica TaxID=4972 RepID=A0AA38HH33_9TREE|nr:uncharacterized protein MKK02DRAFT_41916 [Dioszegia hungarica]KAI9638889.1 hypothetical protein MKK02DRAFT_41916 [Dioszegia hungarica]